MATKTTKAQIMKAHRNLKKIHNEIKKAAHKAVISTVKLSAMAHGKIKPATKNAAKRLIHSISR